MRTRAPLRLLAIVLAAVTTVAGLDLGTAGADTGYPVAPKGIWLSVDEIRSLPTTGSAWSAVKGAADGPLGVAMIADQDSDHDLRTMAAALVYARTGDAAYRAKAASGLLGAIGTEAGGRTLALGRNLVGYVVAADLIDMASFDPAGDRAFRTWLDAVRHVELDGRTLISTHEIRPNNWGTHAGAARVAAAAYLGDAADLERAATVFRGWLGDRSAYAGFKYGDLTWQCDPNRPVGINPAGCTIQGHDVDGVLPDDQRRAGSFTWPPPQENYVWGGLQGAVVQAELLRRQGLDAWQWQGQALHRAVRWLHDVSGYPATGDDTWQPWLVNFAYGSSFPTTAAKLGKNMGFTDWTHARKLGTEATTTSTTSTTSITSTTVATTSTSDTSSTTTGAEDPQPGGRRGGRPRRNH